MKKITSLILVLAMLVSVFSFNILSVSAEGEGNTMSLKNQQTVEILKTLGVANTFLATYNESATMTRRQFCIMMKDFLGKSFGATTNLIPFDDVMDYDPDIGVLRTMTELGFMYGFDDNTFRPDEEVAYEDAITVMVNMLGYKLPAESKGGYPMGYLAVAAQEGLLEGVTPVSGKAITHGDILTLLSNFIGIEVLEQVSFGSESKFQAVENETILAKHFNVYKGDGIVNGTNESMLDMSSALTEDKVQIGESILYVNGTNAKAYFGYDVEYYYELNKSGISKLIGIYPSDKNEELVINVADKGEFVGDELTYTTDNSSKIYRAKIQIGTVTVYNGVAAAFDKNKIDNMEEGNLKFLDNDGDGRYDVLFVNDVEYFVVKNVNKITNIIYGRYYGDMIVLEDESIDDIKYEIIDASGKYTDLSAIKEWDVLSVTTATIEGIKVIKIRIGTNVISGKLEGISGVSGNYEYVVINGIQYKISNTMNKLIDDGEIKDFDLGKDISLVLNAEGNAVTTKDIESSISGKLGYLSDHYAMDISGNNYCLEFIDNTAIKTELSFAPEFKFIYADYRDGKEYEDNIKLKYKYFADEVDYLDDFENFINCLDNCISEGRLVFRYDVNEEGKINEIELATKATSSDLLFKKDRLCLALETGTTKYRVYKDTFFEYPATTLYKNGKNYRLSSSATIFGVPNAVLGDDEPFIVESDLTSFIAANSSEDNYASNVAITGAKFYTYGDNKREFIAGSYPTIRADQYLSEYTVASKIVFVTKVTTSVEEINGERENIINITGITGTGGNSSLKVRDVRTPSEIADKPLKFSVGDIIIPKKGSDGYCTFKTTAAVTTMDANYNSTNFKNNNVPILRILRATDKGTAETRGKFVKLSQVNMIANSGRHGLLSYVVEIDDGKIYIGSFDDTSISDSSTKNDAPKFYDIGSEKVFVFDSKKGEVRKGTLDDIIMVEAGMPTDRGSAHSHTDATVVYMIANITKVETIFVFK